VGRMMAAKNSASRWYGAALFGVFCVAVAAQTLLEHLEMLGWCFVLWGAMAVLWLPAVLRLGTRLQRTRNGLCLCCGYDLRASRGRCPECGAESDRDESAG
jgi:hypothetical protein